MFCAPFFSLLNWPIHGTMWVNMWYSMLRRKAHNEYYRVFLCLATGGKFSACAHINSKHSTHSTLYISINSYPSMYLLFFSLHTIYTYIHTHVHGICVRLLFFFLSFVYVSNRRRRRCTVTILVCVSSGFVCMYIFDVGLENLGRNICDISWICCAVGKKPGKAISVVTPF